MRSVKFINIKVLFLLCYLLCLFPSLSAGNDSLVTFKNWWEYTETDIKRLQERWTTEKVEAVKRALKENKPLPKFFKPQPTVQGSLLSENDLRGINLHSQVINKKHLKRVCLQGANLMHCSLDSADLSCANFQGACLDNAILSHDTMESTDLRYASLKNAKLTGALLRQANFKDADLSGANLREVWLWEANLQNANLTNTKLQCAQLGKANLEDANLYQTVFDTTYLWLANLGTAKNIIYIIWGGTADKRYVIGEEVDESLIWAKNTYRNLKSFYKKELSDEIAAKFHYRENEVITKSYAWYQPGRVLRLLFLNWTYGYGSRPLRLFWYSLGIIGVFGLLFFLMTRFQWKHSGIRLVQTRSEGKEELVLLGRKRMIRKCFYFSLLSFATFGYGAIKPKQWLQLFLLEPVEYKPVRWARIFVGIEAALGIWIFALLVTVLFGR